ncbi:cuticle protein 10.9-like [Limulus polyphemus]|uniref:Cuticle protein 10.9-like n=1 Tax=Limulus polyphemus TaxID=6850 RepID=A0ABM1SHX5_LIMPO|nr:cuticle protein 10.9-like [Limulus polyphemus]
MILKLVIVVLLGFGTSWAQRYRRPVAPVRPNVIGSPEPYEFSYNSQDEFGTNLYKEERGDSSGNVYGKYGYKDAQGLYRHVEYTATNQNGYQASVQSNEPGTSNDNPADVTMIVEPPPPGIQNKYTRPGIRQPPQRYFRNP